jgi:multisubunit Na+/H+ antiporter MnhC subunit
MISAPFVAVAVMMLAGLSALAMKRNMIKVVMGINVIGSGVNLFLISLGYREGSVAPIFADAPSLYMSLPAPQALTLTSIVIGLAVTAMMLSYAVLIHNHYGSLDTRKRRLLQ